MNSKWHFRFLDLAKLVSSWSRDPSTQVGAVIVDNDKRVISIGYNGFAKGVEDLEERYQNRELKYKLIIHAERNALLFAKTPLDGYSMYTYPFAPCPVCASMIIQAGIKKVIAPALPERLVERWGKDVLLSEQIFKEAQVELTIIQNYVATS